ncbi:MAG: carboxypeptidase-like regulatory domain-containing protein [Imperialibacter sp.]|uniref:carboxypeptidase-like regulatory domain-containing protein n=1 Tax=Imperialibacter sp. TaxID=2038411 RepID=UPI0032ED4B60
MTKTFFLLVLLTSMSFWLQAQKMITGKVVSSKSKSPVPFASVRVNTEDGVFGAISNANGDFQIPLKYRDIASSLKISCIGYSTRVVPFSELDTARLNIVQLQESVRELAEVVIKGKKSKVRKLTAKQIVRSAIQNIGQNCPIETSSYVGYYRDYQRHESQYINLNEAIIEVFDEGFDTNDHADTRISLHEYVKNQTFERDTITEVPYDNSARGKFVPGARLFPFGGNELSILRIHDAIRNHNSFSFSFVDVLDSNFVSNHSFKLLPTAYLNETPLYHISFTSKPIFSAMGFSAKGDIYIEKGHFAIHKFEYKNFRKVEKNLELLYSIQIEYARQQSLMHLNYISFNDLFLLKNPMDFETVDIALDRFLNAFTVIFTDQPDEKSVLNVDNYYFAYDDEKLEIDHINVAPSIRPNEVRIYLKPNNIPPRSSADEVTEKLGAKVSGIIDLNGREVNKPTYLQVNQFRELFVQERSFVPRDNTDSVRFINKEKPLSESSIVPEIEIDVVDFWMNKPLKTNN